MAFYFSNVQYRDVLAFMCFAKASVRSTEKKLEDIMAKIWIDGGFQE